jgi:hypothetical protein
MKALIIPALTLLLLTGCSALPLRPEANSVMIVTDKPDAATCKYLGETIGSEGNWVSGDYTSNKEMMIGARNDLRNQAYAMGGNIVHLQQVNSSQAWGALGTTNISIAGIVYRCSK